MRDFRSSGSPGRRWIAFALLLALAGARAAAPDSPSASPASPVHLVHDFFPGELAGDRPLPQLTRLGNTLFFLAADVATGHSVWRTDGTAAGTGQVPITGASPAPDEASLIGIAGRRVFWTAGASGTPDVQVLFAAGETGDATALYSGSLGAIFRVLGQRLFYSSCTATGCAVWSTDGTIAGTGPVPALASQPPGGGLLETLAGRWLVFNAGSALLAYDVTQGRLLPLLSAPGGFSVFPVGETLFILTRGRKDQVWASRLDSPRATLLFTGRRIGIAGWRGDRFYFAPQNGQLWSTDGSPEGTHSFTGFGVESFSLLADQLGSVGSTTLIPLPGYYWGGLLGADETRHELSVILPVCSGKYPCLGISMSAVTIAGNRAFEEVDGHLVRTDGTAKGTTVDFDLGWVDPASFGVLDGRLALGATGKGVSQLWETDGTPRGTKELSDGSRDRPFRVEGPPISYNGAVFVAADRKPVGQQLWRTAGGRATPVTDLRHLASGIYPYQARSVNDHTLLQGAEARGWFSAAADGSVEALGDYSEDICWDDLGPCPTPVTAVGKRLLFARADPLELWSTDGTGAGTVPVKAPSSGILDPTALGWLGDHGDRDERALVLTEGGGLWITNGARSGGTRLITRLPVDPDHPERFLPVGPPVPFGSSSFLFRQALADDGSGAATLEVWRTDGTADGTLRLASTPFFGYSPFLSPVVIAGRLFFRFGGTLWTSDGSATGTHPLEAQLPGGTFALVAGSRTLYALAGYLDEGPLTLWAIDPSTLAASLLGRFADVGGTSIGMSFGSVVDDTLFFDVFNPGGVHRLWLTEGTAATTRQLTGPLAGLTGDFFTAGERRYFTGCEAEHGCELWSTDRLGENNQLIVDLWPGSRSSDPEILAVDDKTLLFAATEPTTGRELWKLDLAALPQSASQSATQGAGSTPPLLSPHRGPGKKRRVPAKEL
jgi:ELWxxDGT repeat protein